MKSSSIVIQSKYFAKNKLFCFNSQRFSTIKTQQQPRVFSFKIPSILPFSHLNLSQRRTITSTPFFKNSASYEKSQDVNNNKEEFVKEEKEQRVDVKQQILATSLPYVEKYGWTSKALEEGARELGLSLVSTGLIENGPVELLFYFFNQSTQQMSQTLINNIDLIKTLRVRDRIFYAVKLRLSYNIPHIKHLSQGLGLLIVPQNIVDSTKALHNVVDEIWFQIGDKSVDINWYTKRAALAGIYSATEIFMSADNSPDFEATWEFLGNRIDNVIHLFQLKESIMSTICGYGSVLAKVVLPRRND